jgi:chromosome segregation ATPase
LPDELPPPPSLRDLPKEILKSSTVENLLSQNEDLMARLKVALRRLSSLEMDNQRLAQAAEEAKFKANISEDQSLILKEKDQLWREKAVEATNEKEILAEKLQATESRLQTTEAELQRHRKYADRIRTQVKPHMLQMKEYAHGLETRVHDLENDVNRREAQVRDLREQIVEVVKNSRIQVEQAEVRSHDVVDSYEKSLSAAKEELELLRASTHDLEIKAARLRRAEQRGDELENEVVELRRNKQELGNRFETECRRLMDRAEELSKENVRFKMENEDLRAKVMEDDGRLKEFTKQTLDLQSQLESLRYLWTARNDENERLKLSLAALEKLNIDLSLRLQEVRSSESASNISKGAIAATPAP